jgi:hypothetical protein
MPTTDPPRPKQLTYLKALAQRTGTSFAYPQTRSEASREIERLRALPSLSSRERGRDRRTLDHDLERQRYATGPHADEITGWVSARWRSQTGPR